jgi:hypothetical protein
LIQHHCFFSLKSPSPIGCTLFYAIFRPFSPQFDGSSAQVTIGTQRAPASPRASGITDLDLHRANTRPDGDGGTNRTVDPSTINTLQAKK